MLSRVNIDLINPENTNTIQMSVTESEYKLLEKISVKTITLTNLREGKSILRVSKEKEKETKRNAQYK